MAKRPTKASAPPPAAATPRKSGRPTSAKPPRPKAAKAAAAAATAASTIESDPVAGTSPVPPPGIEAESSFAMPGAEQREMLETLSMNLARAAMTAQSAIAEAALSQADRPAALSPDPFNVGPAMTSVMTSLAGRPDRLFSAQADLFNRYMDLWASTTRRAAGEQPAPSAKSGGDKRFKDPAWSENPMFDMMRQSYLVTSDWMNGLIASVDDVDPLVKRRAQFFTKLLTDAFSPSNFLLSNPVALREAMRRLWDDPALTERFGANALLRFQRLFTADHMCATTAQVYREVLGNGYAPVLSSQKR